MQYLNDIRGRAPSRFCPILDRMLVDNPDQRYQTPAEVAAALAPFAVARPQRRRKALALTLVLLLLSGGLAAAVYRVATD